MSGGLDILSLKSEDMLKMLAVNAHTGSENLDYQMEQYVYKRTPAGTHIINLRKTWEKLLLAARAIVAIKNPADVYVISTYAKSQRSILKFASYTGATPVAGRFTPGTFTNQIQKNFKEPLLLLVADPYVDHQPIMEAACVNIPVIAFCNAETPMKYVDIAIPCNNKGTQCVGLMFWMLAREVLRFRGTVSRDQPWDVMPDLFFYREPEEVEKDALLEGGVEKNVDADETAATKGDAGVGGASILASQWSSFGQPTPAPEPLQQQQPMMSPVKTQAPIADDDWMHPAAPIMHQQQGQPPVQHYASPPQYTVGDESAQYMHPSAAHMRAPVTAAPPMGMMGPPGAYMQQQQRPQHHQMQGPPQQHAMHQAPHHYRVPEGVRMPPQQSMQGGPGGPNWTPGNAGGMAPPQAHPQMGMMGHGQQPQQGPPQNMPSLNLAEHKPIRNWGDEEGWN